MNEFFLFPIADIAGAFWDSTLPGKIIVIILFLGSAAAWTIMWTKSVQLKTASTSTNIFLADFRKNKNLASLMKNIGKHQNTPLANIFKSGYSTALEIKSESLSDFESNNIGFTSSQLESIRAAVDCSVADQALELEDQMGVLATAVSAAPFLGLLGTVWGVMDAFSGMADSGSAALSAVAPGISGALLTTIIGLIVALPSMIGYNLLSSKIRYIAVQMDNFSQEFVSRISNENNFSED